MKTKTIIILAAIFLGALLAYYAIEKPATDIYEVAASDEAPLFAGLDKDAIRTIETSSKANNVTLYKEDGGWHVKEAEDFPANADQVETLLDSIAKMTGVDVVSENPENASMLRVDEEQGVRVKVTGAKGAEVAHFFIGKNGPARSSYVRVEGSDVVTLQEGVFRYQFDRAPDAWRDRSIVKFDAAKVKRLEIVRPAASGSETSGETASASETIIIEADADGAWTLTAPEYRVGKKSNVENITRTFSNFTASDIPPQNATATTALESPVVTATVTLENGDSHTVLIGAEKADQAGKFYARNADSDLVYLIAKYQVDIFRKSLDEMGDVPPPEQEASPASAENAQGTEANPPPPPSAE